MVALSLLSAVTWILQAAVGYAQTCTPVCVTGPAQSSAPSFGTCLFRTFGVEEMPQCAAWARQANAFTPWDCSKMVLASGPSPKECEDYNTEMERLSQQGLEEDLRFCTNFAAKSTPPSCDQVSATLANVQNLQQMIRDDT
jgi:hypothetical protein